MSRSFRPVIELWGEHSSMFLEHDVLVDFLSEVWTRHRFKFSLDTTDIGCRMNTAMANVIDNAGSARHAKVYWQREDGGKWEGGLVIQSTATLRRTIAEAMNHGKAPKHAYKIEPAVAPHPMSDEAKQKLRARKEQGE